MSFSEPDQPPGIQRRPRARRGTNLPRVADYNQSLVLDLIRRTPGISRVELVRHTGLTAQTMSNICRRLCDADLIYESGRVHAGVGAPRSVFEVNASARFTLGLHIDPARLTLVILDLAGEIHGSLLVSTPDSADPLHMLEAIEESIQQLLAENEVPYERVVGLGVATPGPVDITHGTVVDAPNLPGWELVRLQQELEQRLERPVVIEKDSTAAAVGEAWSSPDAPSNFAFIYLGTGVAAGIVLDGEAMRGASSNIGDIGHMSGDPNGPLCYCGGRGCLATTAMPASLVSEATARELLPPVDLGDARAVEQALARLCTIAESRSGREAAAIVNRTARSYARVAGQLANILDLEAIILGGPQWPALGPALLRIAPAIVGQLFVGRALHNVEVRGTSLGDHAGAVGAASLSMWSATFDAPKQLFLG